MLIFSSLSLKGKGDVKKWLKPILIETFTDTVS